MVDFQYCGASAVASVLKSTDWAVQIVGKWPFGGSYGEL